MPKSRKKKASAPVEFVLARLTSSSDLTILTDDEGSPLSAHTRESLLRDPDLQDYYHVSSSVKFVICEVRPLGEIVPNPKSAPFVLRPL